MKLLTVIGILVIGFSFFIPVEALAGGYTKQENQAIWELRLAAVHHASQEASKKCAWQPERPINPADQLPSNPHVGDKALFVKIMGMLRRDQNARIIANAVGSEESKVRLKQVDAANLPLLKQIVAKHGFPTEDEVGKTGANAMLMLVAHADADLAFQKSVAREMDGEVAAGELWAMYPKILRAIRPEIARSSTAPRKPAPVAPVAADQPHTPGSGPQCYLDTRNRLKKAYIRSHY